MIKKNEHNLREKKGRNATLTKKLSEKKVKRRRRDYNTKLMLSASARRIPNVMLNLRKREERQKVRIFEREREEECIA